MRKIDSEVLLQAEELYKYGLTKEMIGQAVEYVHETLDSMDSQLTTSADARLSQLVELANLSSIVGNLFRVGVCKVSDDVFLPNKPHTYPDLLANKLKQADACDVEIKVALESNKPKGHLVKPGPHIAVRYVLANEEGDYTRGKENRGIVPYIWEVRIGELKDEHFNVSNTEGDSGKTAVINAAGMNELSVVYIDKDRCPVVRHPSIPKPPKAPKAPRKKRGE
ncbi:hypothetical protein [Stenotrophomonas maltophilia]|uniref:hypothetical protein n=1 Tax=Stenotrophomonas maltophilia TaxID=40324 RepID=UPI0022B7D3A6|nr:hypothetical protein [Stenotrophomonas maltophilia]MCZ7845730.1 hypothetical protein [Stenotrophomonas maltophilia]